MARSLSTAWIARRISGRIAIAVSYAAGQARRRWQLGQNAKAHRERERAHALLIDFGFKVRMADRMIPGCVKPRPIFPEIIEICTGKDLRVGKPSDATIQVKLYRNSGD